MDLISRSRQDARNEVQHEVRGLGAEVVIVRSMKLPVTSQTCPEMEPERTGRDHLYPRSAPPAEESGYEP